MCSICGTATLTNHSFSSRIGSRRDFLLWKHGLTGRAQLAAVLAHAGGDGRDVRNLACTEAESVRRTGRPLFGGKILSVARNAGAQHADGGCEAQASATKTHFRLPDHPALLRLAICSVEDAAGRRGTP